MVIFMKIILGKILLTASFLCLSFSAYSVDLLKIATNIDTIILEKDFHPITDIIQHYLFRILETAMIDLWIQKSRIQMVVMVAWLIPPAARVIIPPAALLPRRFPAPPAA